jgi:hypothetical protein
LGDEEVDWSGEAASPKYGIDWQINWLFLFIKWGTFMSTAVRLRHSSSLAPCVVVPSFEGAAWQRIAA